MASSSTDGPGEVKPVSLEVIVVGLPRTGTRSMMTALQTLGYHEVFHMPEGVYGVDTQDTDLWIRALKYKFRGIGSPLTKVEWDRLLGRFQAITDGPPMLFSEEIITAYPDAKVILTTRDTALVWAQSLDKVLNSMASVIYDRHSVVGNFMLWMAPQNPFTKVAGGLLEFSPLSTLGTGDKAQEYYQQHNQRMRNFAEEHGKEFLEFNVKEGWKPLCEFLRKEVPGTDFPKTNERELVDGKLALMKKQLDDGAKRNIVACVGFASIGLVLLFGRGHLRALWSSW